jgi:Domain of unknown function (DUF4388)
VQLNGKLGQFSLHELIEMIVYSSVAGVLEIGTGDRRGQIFFRDGLPYHAVYSDCVGFDAVCKMFQRHTDPFRFVAGEVCSDDTLSLDPWDMIERAEQQALLWERVLPRIPSLSWIPTLCTTNAEHIQISESVWPVLSAVDGQRNVTAIAALLNLAALDVCLALISLLDQGLIMIKQPLPALLTPRPSNHLPAGGFFERLIAGIPDLEGGAHKPLLADLANETEPHLRVERK